PYSDQHGEPSEPFRQLVGFGIEHAGFRHPHAQIVTLARCNSVQLRAKSRAGGREAGLIEERKTAAFLLLAGALGGWGELAAAVDVQRLELPDARALLRIAPDEPFKLINLPPCQAPFVVVKA